MNKHNLLKQILNSKELLSYWPDVDLESINYNNLIRPDQTNKYLKAIYYLMSEEGSKKSKLSSILTTFKIQP